MTDEKMVRYQEYAMCSALHRNINDNFESISFSIDKGKIYVRIILTDRTEKEDEYIEDICTEFEALQESNCVKGVEIIVGKTAQPLANLVYSKCSITDFPLRR